jgi:DnaA-homolog protein
MAGFWQKGRHFTPMKQLLLDINVQTPPSLDTFVVGRHAEMIELLRLFAQRLPSTWDERIVYIWGETGAGKSHLLHALASYPHARYMNTAAEIDYSPEVSLYLLDDCQNLNDAQQIAAFNLFNQVKENKAFLVATGTAPPALLKVREDLRTRLGWGLIYQLHGLSDEEKIAALEAAANARGIVIPTGVLSYLMTHYRRDMPGLSYMVEALIHFALETKRPITLPLLRELLY